MVKRWLESLKVRVVFPGRAIWLSNLLKSTEQSRCFMFLFKGECLTLQALLFTDRVCFGDGESGVVHAIEQPDAFPWGRVSRLSLGERSQAKFALGFGQPWMCSS